MRLPWLILLGWECTAQELWKEANPPLGCLSEERVVQGDRVLLDYEGWLEDGRMFDAGAADFVVGEGKVIRGWEEGIIGQCAGEMINMTIPPNLWAIGYKYGDDRQDKVPASSTLQFSMTLNGVVRVIKAPPGGDCYSSEKACDFDDKASLTITM